jgi:hypothetical protein
MSQQICNVGSGNLKKKVKVENIISLYIRKKIEVFNYGFDYISITF